MTKTKSNKFFFISFLPALAYWYLESNYSLRIALIGGLGLAILELAFEYFYFKHTHLISRVNFVLILLLGGLSLLGEDGIWFKLQPFFTGVGMGGFLLFQNMRNQSVMNTMIGEFNSKPPPRGMVVLMERHMCYFTISYGFFMAYIAFNATTDQWVFFKTIGFYVAFGIFFIFEMIFLRKKKFE